MDKLEKLTETFRITSDFIKQMTGIELTWAEKIGLKMYINKFTEEKLWDNAVHYFMLDYFGIDWITMGSTPVCLGEGIDNDAWMTYGMDFLGTPEFKEYCRNHVQQWRDERELI